MGRARGWEGSGNGGARRNGEWVDGGWDDGGEGRKVTCFQGVRNVQTKNPEGQR